MRGQFEVVSGVFNQHELVALSETKDTVVNVKKWWMVNPAAHIVAFRRK